jgi:hypothetical protein
MGLPIARGGTRFNHLFFADDSLLFCKTNIFEWLHIQAVLDTYEKASSQKLNKNKMSIFFSRNTKAEAKAHILSVAGISSTKGYEKYLGLPAIIGQSKMKAFGEIKGKVWERINGWKEKYLSQGGKEILLKAVIQAIPIYTLSVFLLPKILRKDINSMMSRFWWGNKENDSKMAWMSWERMGWPKNKGGLGFRDLETFNLALLAKQGWRLHQNPDSLVAKIYKEKYYSHVNFLQSSLGRSPSYVWRSIWTAKKLLEEGLVWRVGDGRSIKIWEDKWVESPITYAIQSLVQILDRNDTVSELIDRNTNWWNINMLDGVFSEEEAAKIGGMAICPGEHGINKFGWEIKMGSSQCAVRTTLGRKGMS